MFKTYKIGFSLRNMNPRKRFLSYVADVDVLHRGVRELFMMEECRQAIEAVVRYFGDSDMSLARIRIGVLRKMRLRQNSEQRCLAHLRQTDDAGFHRELLAIRQFQAEDK